MVPSVHFPGSPAREAWLQFKGSGNAEFSSEVELDAMASWAERLTGVRGVLLDISGVLCDSSPGGATAIAGSVEAVARLVSSTPGGAWLCRYREAGRSR